MSFDCLLKYVERAEVGRRNYPLTEFDSSHLSASVWDTILVARLENYFVSLVAQMPSTTCVADCSEP